LVIKECVVLEATDTHVLNNKIRTAVSNNFVPLGAATCHNYVRLITMVKYKKEGKL
jgi:hypothetical protein